MTIENRKPTQRNISASETKNKIFHTALMLFEKYGYEKVTIKDITKHANVSKGNFYTHFQSKDSVLVEQFNRIDSHYISIFKEIPSTESASNRLRILIGAMCDYCENVCGINAIQVVYANQISATKITKILNNTERPFYSLIQEIVILGQSNGEFRSDIEPDKLMELIARFCRALLYDWCLYNDSFDLKTEGDNYTNFILNALNQK